MGSVAIGFGLVLALLGIGGYYGTEQQSWTALIPAGFGAALVVLGILALRESLRKHAMHAAAAFGLIGCLAGLGRFGSVAARGKDLPRAGPLASLAMGLLCGVFVALCVRSFVLVRRARKEGEAQPPYRSQG